MSETVSFAGRTFHAPAPAIAPARDERLALAFIAGGAVTSGLDVFERVVAPDAVDLSLVNTGRCPLLAEHCYALEALLGRVELAEVDGPVLRCLVRFCHSPEADRIWNMLADGFPLSLSMGTTVRHAEKLRDLETGGSAYRITRWALREVSVCVRGRDQQAHIRALSADENVRALAETMRERHLAEPARSTAAAVLQRDRWRRWATAAGARMADRLGTDHDQLAELLAAEVAAHCEQLAADHCLLPTAGGERAAA